MFDPNSDMFKPIIGGRLIRDEAKIRLERDLLIKRMLEEQVDTDLGKAQDTLQGEGVPIVPPERGGKEIA